MSNVNIYTALLKSERKAYSGWKSIQIDKSLLNIAGTFSFGTTDVRPYSPSDWDIRLGSTVTIEINGQQVIQGYVNDMPIRYDANGHSITVAGRDVTGDLVDCSASYLGNDGTAKIYSQKNNLTVLEIIRGLCGPFDIPVLVDAAAQEAVATRIDRFVPDLGETVHEIISKYCRHVAVLPVSYGDGNLTLTRGGCEHSERGTPSV
jgi:prophage tail gpP-like protein